MARVTLEKLSMEIIEILPFILLPTQVAQRALLTKSYLVKDIDAHLFSISFPFSFLFLSSSSLPSFFPPPPPFFFFNDIKERGRVSSP